MQDPANRRGLAADKAFPIIRNKPRRRESRLFQWAMDSGSALRFARHDDFDQPPSHSSSDKANHPRCPRHRQTPPTGRTTPRTLLSRTNTRRPRLPQNAPHPKGNSVAAWQAHVPPMMTDLSASPNGSIGPLATDPASRSPPANPGNPASRSRADPIRAQFGPADSRHCHASPTGLAPD